MKGILMLRDLNTKYPQNVSVIVQLARLAISTGQWERAEQRLKEALELDSQNRQATCLMVEVLNEKGESSLAQSYADKCNEE
jgi:Tfp pilus assembly protein PilF